MNYESVYLTEKLLWNYKEQGEKEFILWFKENKDYLKKCYENSEIDYQERYYEAYIS